MDSDSDSSYLGVEYHESKTGMLSPSSPLTSEESETEYFKDVRKTYGNSDSSGKKDDFTPTKETDTSGEAPTFEVPKEKTMSRGEFLVNINKHIEKVKDDLVPNTMTRISSGTGILCCTILSVNQVCVEVNECFVKVLYVEPGSTDNVLFRSKQNIYTTKPSVSNKHQVYTLDAYFEHDIYPPLQKHEADPSRMVSDWNSLMGDLLFTVYETSNGRSNKFLGQTILPLRGLVEGLGESVHGGEQKQHREERRLFARDGATVVEGSLELCIQLQLPPDEPCTPPASPLKARKIKLNPTEKKNNSSDKRKFAKLAKRQMKQKFRMRKLQSDRIARENEKLYQRINTLEPTMKLANCKQHTPVGKKLDHVNMNIKRVRGVSYKRVYLASEENVGGKKRVEVHKQSIGELLESIQERRANISDCTQKLGLKKSGIARCETLIKKLRSQLNTLKQNDKDPVPSYSFVKPKKKKKSKKKSNVDEADLRKLRPRVLTALEKHNISFEQESTLKQTIDQLDKKQEEINAQIFELKEKTVAALARSRRRREGKTSTEPSKPAASHTKLLQEAKIELQVLESNLRDTERTCATKLKTASDDIEYMKTKLEKRQQKIQNEQNENEKISKIYDEKNYNNQLSQLRLKVGQLRAQLLLV